MIALQTRDRGIETSPRLEVKLNPTMKALYPVCMRPFGVKTLFLLLHIYSISKDRFIERIMGRARLGPLDSFGVYTLRAATFRSSRRTQKKELI